MPTDWLGSIDMAENPYESADADAKIQHMALEDVSSAHTIAKYQKAIICLLLASVPAWLIPYGPIVTGFVAIVLVYQLAQALQFKDLTGLLILSFIPIVKLFVMLYVNGKATKFLRSHGIRVGLMGANKDDLAKITSSSL